MERRFDGSAQQWDITGLLVRIQPEESERLRTASQTPLV
jgi:hypothetical protein